MAKNDCYDDTQIQFAGSGLNWKSVELEVLTYWANQFGLSTKDLLCSGTTLLPDSDLAGPNKAKLYRIKERSVLCVDPNWTNLLRWVTEPPFDTVPLSVEDMLDYCAEDESHYGCKNKNSYIIDYIASDNFVHHPAPDGITIRRLVNGNAADDESLDELIQACTKKEVHEAGGRDTFKSWPVTFGAFKGGRLVGCVACHYVGEKRLFAWPGMLVDPHHRREGIAIATLSALCKWCIANGKIVMGHRRADHPASGHIAHALGAKDMVTEDSIGLWQKTYT